MLFNSISFLVYFPIVIFMYFIIPEKIKKVWLLVASYYFYMSWNVQYGFLILLSTVITYICGRLVEGQKNVFQKKVTFALSLASNFGILFFFKYFEWMLDNINSILGGEYSLPFTIILPVGISFYSFQAIGYTFDVYRGKLRAEKNFVTYALFVSFFPQLVAGPIERSTNLLCQLQKPTAFKAENATKGLQIMLWGYVEKMVIADNLAIVVDQVYANCDTYGGSVLVFATVLLAFQIYCDFGGYSHIAIGAAKVLNITLMENFRQPFFARTVREHWQRWHVSLSGWFRDYLYIPMGGSRCSRPRKYFNLIVTFLASGMWHGASWHYIVWGGLQGVAQVIGEILYPVRQKGWKLLHVDPEHVGCQTLQRIITFSIFVITLIAFRAPSMHTALQITRIIMSRFAWGQLVDGTLMTLGLNSAQILLVGLALLLLFVVDAVHEKGGHLSVWIGKKPIVVRYGIYYALLSLILVSVLQTFGQSAASFLYFQF